MFRLSVLACLVVGLIGCDDDTKRTAEPVGGHVLRSASVHIGAGMAVDDRHTLQAGAASGAVVSTNNRGRLVAVIAD